MAFTRRSFIGKLSIAAIASSVGVSKIFAQRRSGGQLFQVPASSYTDFYLTSKHFEPLVGSVFSIDGTKMRLRKVIELTNETNRMRGYYGESFSLIFDGPDEVSSGTYQVKHPAIGEFSMFVSAVGITGKEYEIVINQIRL